MTPVLEQGAWCPGAGRVEPGSVVRPDAAESRKVVGTRENVHRVDLHQAHPPDRPQQGPRVGPAATETETLGGQHRAARFGRGKRFAATHGSQAASCSKTIRVVAGFSPIPRWLPVTSMFVAPGTTQARQSTMPSDFVYRETRSTSAGNGCLVASM